MPMVMRSGQASEGAPRRLSELTEEYVANWVQQRSCDLLLVEAVKQLTRFAQGGTAGGAAGQFERVRGQLDRVDRALFNTELGIPRMPDSSTPLGV
ncbi:MAG: hypothetical protein EXR72_26645 [Myxococcales bacterium]|nr:hypothetical protein [Myxococcales bacterium]